MGTVQDAGSPHIGCEKSCCSTLFETPDATRKGVSLGLYDAAQGKTYLFDATPDLPAQLRMLHTESSVPHEVPAGIFLTHAHIGHYSGLMYFGREALGAKSAQVYAMPKMATFLTNNGPWDQLVKLGNIALRPLRNEKTVSLGPGLEVTPFLVPHRDEYSETVGFKISGPNKTALFIPDIDKWGKWDKQIIAEIAKVDYAFLDATFYDGEEIKHRDISEIPHPFVIESMALFEQLSPEERAKIHFIHLNHTNPLLDANSEASRTVNAKGFHVARFGDRFQL